MWVMLQLSHISMRNWPGPASISLLLTLLSHFLSSVQTSNISAFHRMNESPLAVYCIAEWCQCLRALFLVWTIVFKMMMMIIIVVVRVFCPRAGLSLQAQEPRLQFCWRLHCLSSIWTDLKDIKKVPRAPTRRWGEAIWLTRSSGLHRNSP